MKPRPQFQAGPGLFSFEAEPHFGGAEGVKRKLN